MVRVHPIPKAQRDWVIEHYLAGYLAIPGTQSDGSHKKGDKKTWVKKEVLMNFLDAHYANDPSVPVDGILEALASALRNEAKKPQSEQLATEKQPRHTSAKMVYWRTNAPKVEARARMMRNSSLDDEADSDDDDEKKAETTAVKLKAAGLTWQRRALDELFEALDDEERYEYEHQANEINGKVDAGPDVGLIYQMQEHLEAAVAKVLEPLIGFGTNQLGAVMFSVQSAYLNKAGNIQYKHQLVFPHRDWTNVISKDDVVAPEQARKFLDSAESGFKLAAIPKPKPSQLKQSTCSEPRATKKSKTAKHNSTTKTREVNDNDDEDLHEELRALEDEAKQVEGDDQLRDNPTDQVLAKLVERRRLVQECQAEREAVKRAAALAAQEAEDSKRKAVAEAAALIELDIPANHVQPQIQDEVDLIVRAPRQLRRSRKVVVDEEQDEEEEDNRDKKDKEEMFVDEPEEMAAEQPQDEEEHAGQAAPEGLEGQVEPGEQERVTVAPRRGKRKADVAQDTGSEISASLSRTTRATKRKAVSGTVSAPRKSARLHVTDDAPRATRSTTNAKKPVTVKGKKSGGKGRGRR